jgi:hypothetical protein
VSGGQMPQPPLDPIAGDSIPNRSADHKANACPVVQMPLDQMPLIQMHSMNHQRGSTYAYATLGCLSEILSTAHSQRSVQHAVNRPRLGGKPAAAFTTPGRNNSAARAGPHP